MKQFLSLPFRPMDCYKEQSFRSSTEGETLLERVNWRSTPSLLMEVFLLEEKLYVQWEEQAIPMYTEEQREIRQHLLQGYGVYTVISQRKNHGLALPSQKKHPFSCDVFFFQEKNPVGHWEISLKPKEKEAIAACLRQTLATLRDPSHHFLFSLTEHTKGFAYSLGYYPTEAEEKEGYDRSSQCTFRIYGEKYHLLLRVVEEANCLRVVRVEPVEQEKKSRKQGSGQQGSQKAGQKGSQEKVSHGLSLAQGSLSFVTEQDNRPQKKTIPDSALQLLKERDGAEYIKLWDSYAQAEGELLLKKIRRVGEIVFTQCPQRRVTEGGTFEYVGQLKDPQQGNRFQEVKETRGTLLLSTEYPHHLGDTVSWTAYSQRKRDRDTTMAPFRSAQYSRPEEDGTSEKKNLLFYKTAVKVVEQRCQFTYQPWNNTLIMYQDKKTPLHFGAQTLTPEEEKIQEKGEKEERGEGEASKKEEKFPKIYITLDLGGDATGIKRRNQARHRMQDGESANPQMGKVMEGQLSTLTPPQEILDPLTLDGVMTQCFPHGATLSQRKAVELALNTPDIALIQGPPGTGKTTVITAVIEGIQQELQQDQRQAGEILITSYQHDAVDYVQKKIRTGSLPPVKFEGKELSEETSALDIWRQEWETRFLATHPNLATTEPMAQLEEQYKHYLAYPKEEEARHFLEAALPFATDPQLQKRIHERLTEVSKSTQKHQGDVLRVQVRKLRTTRNGFLDDGVERASDVVFALCGEYYHPQGASLREQGRKQFPLLFQSLTMTADTLTSDFLQAYGEEKKRLLSGCYAPPTLGKVDQEITEIYSLLVQGWKTYNPDTGTPQESAIFQELWDNVQRKSRKSFRDMMSRYTLVYGATLQHSVANPMAKAKLGKQSLSHQGISFDTVIVDEAARANPMDLMIAITQGRRRLILVGDHRQLPQVYDEELLERLQEEEDISLGLSQSKESMFQYLMAMGKKLEGQDGIPRTITLKEQFRMHPLLGEFINRQFYATHDPQESFSSPLPQENFTQTLESVPLLWYHVPCSHGGGQTVRWRNSWKRDLEATCIVETLCTYLAQDPSYTFGVITFYSGQKEEILSQLETKKREVPHLREALEQVEVGTVDSFQGKEFDVIFLSLVRSQPPKLSGKYKEEILTALSRREVSSPSLLEGDGSLLDGDPPVGGSGNPEEVEPTLLEQLGRRTYGFMTMENRLCVALSRQKSLLVVVGNSDIYGGDPQWSTLAEVAVPALKHLYEFTQKEGKVKRYGNHTSSPESLW